MLSTSNNSTETNLEKWKRLKSRVMIDQLAPLHHLESMRDPSGHHGTEKGESLFC